MVVRGNGRQHHWDVSACGPPSKSDILLGSAESERRQIDVSRSRRFVVLTRILTLISAVALTLVLFAQDKGGQDKQDKDKKGPQWKDQAEYDLFNAAANDANAQTRLATLEKWKQQYP